MSAIDVRWTRARASISSIGPRDAADRHERGALLVDTRPAEQRSRFGEIPGAVIIDRNVLEWRLDPSSPHRHELVTSVDQSVIVLCQEGYSSVLAVEGLARLGLTDVHDLAGGFEAWAAAGLRTTKVPTTLEVETLTGSLGAIVHGVDLRAGVSPEETAAIRDALGRYRVLFFRDQPVTPTQLVAFGRAFGELTPAHPLVGGLDDDHPEILVLDSTDYPLGVGSRGQGTSYNNRWHTDVTFSERPPLGSILAAKRIPARGGDTLWADLVDAYATLSPALQQLLLPLRAVHDACATFDRFRADDPTGEQGARLAKLAPVEHPVVRRHPETGELGLFVNPTFTRRVVGLAESESAALLQLLYAHAVEPERTVRWRWREGDVAFWDNRATAHYAAADYSEPRLMHRITVAGDRPSGPET
jgi:alpha-ketoglutarate-dependent taurine dioxygenase/rhodanese-related sulfurtransferase